MCLHNRLSAWSPELWNNVSPSKAYRSSWYWYRRYELNCGLEIVDKAGEHDIPGEDEHYSIYVRVWNKRDTQGSDCVAPTKGCVRHAAGGTAPRARTPPPRTPSLIVVDRRRLPNTFQPLKAGKGRRHGGLKSKTTAEGDDGYWP